MNLSLTPPTLMTLARRLIFAACGLALCGAALAQSTYQNVVLGDNPLAYYALNPGVDGTSTAPRFDGKRKRRRGRRHFRGNWAFAIHYPTPLTLTVPQPST